MSKEKDAYVRTFPKYEEYWTRSPSDGNPQSITVQEQIVDDFSGLYDAKGNKLYRKKERMGFIKDD